MKVGLTMEVVFLGSTGSIAYNNASRVKYGTNSICVALKAGGESLIFDAGSGICGFNSLADFQSERSHIFLSHYHTDHVCGLLFFPQFFNKQKKFNVYGPSDGENDCRSVIDRFLSPPFHPVGLNAFGAEMSFHTINAGDIIPLSDSVTVRTHGLSHPGGSLGYRVEYAGKSFCYCTDVELQDHQSDRGLLEFIRGADLLALDGFFDEGKVLSGWGHSSWQECAEWAKHADAKKLALFHHSFSYSDTEIDAMEEKARFIFADAFAAADFMRVRL